MVAFFSIEYALNDQTPFAGGLGVLTADYLMECGKQGFPLVAVGLAYGQKPGIQEFGSAKLILLESEFKQPYDSDLETQIKKEMFLAFEGIKLLKSLDLKPDVYHLNEGHTAFVILADPKGKFVATKHTVLSASGLHIPKDIFLKLVSPDEKIYEQGSDVKHPDFFSANKFMLKFAAKSNGVSIKHCEVEREVHQNSPLISITNGINLDRWQSWDGTWENHQFLKQKMLDFVNQKTGANLKNNILTFVWARRLAEYKQPEMILENIEKLSKLPVQIIVAGEVNSLDPAQASIAERLAACKFITFLPHYNLEIAKILTIGADVWLNTPVVGKEACGTSGMKAGCNGVLLFSTPDGWVPEEDWSTGGGWIINNLYDQIEKDIVPIYYNHRDSWLAHMKLIKKMIETKYTTARMLAEYKNKLYNI